MGPLSSLSISRLSSSPGRLCGVRLQLQRKRVLLAPIFARNQEFAVRDQVRHSHAFAPGIAARLRDIASQGHGIDEAGRDRSEVENVAVLQRTLQAGFVQFDFLDAAIFTVLDLLNVDLAAIRRNGQPAGHLQDFAKTGLVSSVRRWPDY